MPARAVSGHCLIAVAVLLLGQSLPGLCRSAAAAGFALREGSADWLSNAYAGDAAKAYDASTADSNPAGMVRLRQSEIDASVNWIDPHAQFSGQAYGPTGQPIAGSQGGNAIQSSATGALFGVWSYAPNVKFGLAVTTPFGLRSNYPGDFVGRYQGLSSSVSATDVALSAAVRVTDHLSIGGGPVIDYLQTRLTDAVNAGPGPLSNLQDEIKGDSVSAGYNLGLLYEFDDRTRIGLDYRSRIHHTLGVQNALSAPQPFTGLLPYTRINSTTQVTLPDSVTIAVYHQLSPRWALLAQAQWTHWSLFNNVTITPGIGPGGAPTIVAENFRNSWFGSVGANWRVTDSLTLQAGVGYDESPVTDANRTLRVPDNDRVVLGAGLTYAVTAGTRVMVGYGHQFLAGPSVHDSAGGVGVLVGRYQENNNSYSGGLSVRF